MKLQSNNFPWVRRAALPLAGAALAVAVLSPLSVVGLVDMNPPSAQAAVTGFYTPAPPAENIDLNRDVTVRFRIPTASGSPSGSAKGYQVTVDRLDTEPINTLGGYTQAAKISVGKAREMKRLERFSGVTNSEGIVEFSALKPGVYLFSATPPTGGGRKPQQDVIVVPTINEDGQWSYDFTAVAKFEVEVQPTPTTVPPPTITTRVTPPPQTTTVTPPPGSTTVTPPPVQPPSTPPGPNPGQLALTGARVLGIVGLAIALILGGFVVLMAGRRKEQG